MRATGERRDKHHAVETLIPFTEANKLVSGNVNVRAPKESSKPFKKMIETVETNPRAFHIKNRGITFICESFELAQHATSEPNRAVLVFERDCPLGLKVQDADGRLYVAVFQGPFVVYPHKFLLA
jgi:hypothetical protein